MSDDRQHTPRVHIDESICIGSGTCARLAPGAFALDQDRGVAAAIDTTETPAQRLRLAERACPTGAIVIDGG